MNAIRTFATLVLAVAMSLAAIIPSAAQNRTASDLLTYFYADPKPERLAGFLDGYTSILADWTAYPPLVGFFAVTFRRHPDWVDRLLPARFNAKTAETVEAAFRLSGLPPMAQSLRARLAEAGQDEKLRAELANLPTRPEDVRITTVTHLDILWGAFFASGDAHFVRMILDYFAETANRSEDIALDVSKLTIAMTGGPKEFFAEIRTKYDEATLRQFVNVSAAQWALLSNSRQHPIVKKTVDTYIAGQPDSFAAQSLESLLGLLK